MAMDLELKDMWFNMLRMRLSALCCWEVILLLEALLFSLKQENSNV